MGVKSIKEHYNIGHSVEREGENICIGSPYIYDIIVINPEGKLIKTNDRGGNNEDLARYQKEFIEDPELLKKLFHQADSFRNLKTVYTHKKGRVLIKQCEKYGWPNNTTDGFKMYDNTHFKTYGAAYKSLLENSKIKYDWSNFKRNIKDHLHSIGKQIIYFYYALYEWFVARTISYFQYLLHK